MTASDAPTLSGEHVKTKEQIAEAIATWTASVPTPAPKSKIEDAIASWAGGEAETDPAGRSRSKTHMTDLPAVDSSAKSGRSFFSSNRDKRRSMTLLSSPLFGRESSGGSSTPLFTADRAAFLNESTASRQAPASLNISGGKTVDFSTSTSSTAASSSASTSSGGSHLQLQKRAMLTSVSSATATLIDEWFGKLCQAVHADYDQCRPGLIQSVNAAVPKAASTKTPRALTSRTTRSALEALQKSIGEFLSQQTYLDKVVVVQERVRTKQQRGKYLAVPSRAALLSMHTTFRELRQSETEYNGQLSDVVNEHLKPVRIALASQKVYAPLPLEMQDMPVVFNNCEELQQAHVKLKTCLDRIYQSSWPELTGLGAAFKQLSLHLNQYQRFASQWHQGAAILSSLSARADPKSAATVSRLLENLTKPTERLEHYESFLSRFVNDLALLTKPGNTWETELDACQQALVAVQNASAIVRAALRRSSDMTAVAQIQRNLEYDSGPLNLLDNDSRRLLFSGPICNKKKYIFLLSDLIIVSKAPNPSTGHFKAVGPKIDLRDKDFKLTVSSSDRSCLVLGTREIRFASNEELRIWHSRISEALLGILASSAFGSPLGSGRNGKDIPPVVVQTVRYLANPEISALKGIFRLSGTKQGCLRIQSAFDNGQDPRLNDPNIYPHDVATVLKQFFRELPQPLIPFGLYAPLIAAIDLLGDSDTDGLVQRFRSIFASEEATSKPAHLLTLRFLLEFLKNVATYSSVSMMTPHNLAIVFAPNILRPLVENMESSLQTPLANGVVETLIERYEEIFPAPFTSSVKFTPMPSGAAAASSSTD